MWHCDCQNFEDWSYVQFSCAVVTLYTCWRNGCSSRTNCILPWPQITHTLGHKVLYAFPHSLLVELFNEIDPQVHAGCMIFLEKVQVLFFGCKKSPSLYLFCLSFTFLKPLISLRFSYSGINFIKLFSYSISVPLTTSSGSEYAGSMQQLLKTCHWSDKIFLPDRQQTFALHAPCMEFERIVTCASSYLIQAVQEAKPSFLGKGIPR